MLGTIFTYYVVCLAVLSFFCLYRAYQGPTSADRVLSVNVILTKTVTILCVMSVLQNSKFFIDIAIVYALIGFVGTIVLAKFIETKQLSRGAKDA
jgi:multicomponent Na+:H+ antiporter subunit F